MWLPCPCDRPGRSGTGRSPAAGAEPEGEIEQGIARVRGRGDRHQASALERWVRDVETGFEDRVLPVTLPVAGAWGRRQYAQPVR
jgi:hypothetical protein